MDRVQRYLDVVPLPVLIAAPLLAVCAFVLIPRKWHLDAALIGTVVWLVLGRLTDLGTIQSVTKATGFAALIAVGVAAYFEPGPKRRLPMIVWAYPALGLVAYVYVLTVVDVALALVIRTQWVILTVAAIFVARTIVDQASLHRVLRALGIGACIAIFAPLSDLLLHPAEAIRKGLGRFEPYGANSNQIGVLFTLAAPLALYLAYQSRHALMKPAYFAGSAMALGMGMLTGSRSTLVTMIVPAIPTGLKLCRKPLWAVVGGVMGVFILGYVIAQAAGNTAFDRYKSIETGRVELFQEYVRESVAQRPIFGLLGTHGMSVLREEEEGQHAHNAYLEATYIGGLSYSFPLLVLVGLSLLGAAYIFVHRRRLGFDTLTLSFISVLMYTVYAQGWVNGVIYWPTYEWAFVHVLLSVLVMGIAWDARQGAAHGVEWDQDWESVYTEEVADGVGQAA